MIKKKILILIPCPAINLDMDINVVEPLQEMFSQTLSYCFLDKYTQLGGKWMNKEVQDIRSKYHPDFVFIHMIDEEFFKSTMRQFTELDSIVIGWFSDDHVMFERYSKWWGSFLSYSITTDKISYESYKKLGIDSILSQWAANPNHCHPYSCPQRYDVTFIGGIQSHRQHFFKNLRDSGIDIRLFGKSGGKYLPYEEIIKLYSQSKINLNLTDSWIPGIKQIKARIFEVTMSGGFLLTEYAPYLEDYFEIGKEVLCFDNVKDAVGKIRYYLEHEDERKKIAHAGRERCLRDHTWDKRFREVFKTIEELESQRRLKKSENALGAISENERPPYWPGNSYEEKRKYQFLVALFHTRWGIKFIKKRQFAVSVSEFMHAVSEYPFVIFNWSYQIMSFLKARIKTIIPLKVRKIINRALWG